MSEETKTKPTIFTVKESAMEIRTSEQVIRDRIEAGELKAFKVGTGPHAPIRIKAEDLEALLVPVVPKADRRD